MPGQSDVINELFRYDNSIMVTLMGFLSLREMSKNICAWTDRISGV